MTRFVRITFSVRALAAALALLAFACTSEADRQAKQRIFSPEDPSPDIVRAAESLDVAGAESTPELWNRLMRMDRLESTRRLGAHEAKTKVTFRWKRAGAVVALTEEAEFATDASGHFKALLTNDEDAGLEFIWTDGRAFAKSRYGPFRERRIDRAQHDVWRNRATGSLQEVFELYDGQLRPRAEGRVAHAGRDARRYSFVLGERFGEAAPERDLPPRVFPKFKNAEGELVTGPDDDTARRIAFAERRIPRSAKGEVIIDDTTGVILKARLEGTFTVADPRIGDAVGEEAELVVTVDFLVTPKDGVKISPPEQVVSTAIPHGLKDPLSFLGDAKPAQAPAEPEDD